METPKIHECRNPIVWLAALIVALWIATDQSHAETVVYDLTLAEKPVTVAGTSVSAMTLNGGIPGPTLHFREGDRARIHVHNRMTVPTSIHWHGLLVPPDMDGVPNISFPSIAPGSTFTYEFPIRQSGTYWYHSHSELQEQRGLYGGIVILSQRESLAVDRDYVVLFSDWTVEDPHTVLHWLKRGTEWYALEKGASQSLVGAVKARRFQDYLKRELQRMPPMDLADVAYDRFLANGNPEIALPAAPGERVRLRIIDGSATTYFHLEFTGGPMTLVAADGLAVDPVEKQRFLIGVAETYDVIVRIPDEGSYELRATAHDGSGYASVMIGSGMRKAAPDVPKAELYDAMHPASWGSLFALTPAGAMGMADALVESGMLDKPGMGGMHGMEEAHAMEHKTVPHAKRFIPHADAFDLSRSHMAHAGKLQEPVSGRGFGSRFGFLEADIASRPNRAKEGGKERPGTPYAQLRSPIPTAFSEGKPVEEFRLTLDGDMERYVWMMNNKILAETDHLRVREGTVVRFILINRTMMHHPMHLHGHFFRVVNGQGDHAPLKHTVDVAPMGTTVIEFYTGETGDWFFHCHLLYHMKSGMARLVHYDGFSPDSEVQKVRPSLYRDPWYLFADAEVLTHMTTGLLTLGNSRHVFTADWEAGWQDVEETEWETVLTARRHWNRFASFFAGVDISGAGAEEEETRGVLGLTYLLPLNLNAAFWVDTDGDARFTLEKELHLTPRITVTGEVEYDTRDLWEGAVGIAYTMTRQVSLAGKWHSEYGFGAGLQIRF